MAITQEHINPDMEWYRQISTSRDIDIRCPYANFASCPRYYESLSLLSGASITTQLTKKEDDKLLRKWKKSKFWPKMAEESTDVSISDDHLSSISKFCPEVSYDTFGLFSSGLAYYANEIDRDTAHEQLSAMPNTSGNDSRWRFSYVIPLHYFECK